MPTRESQSIAGYLDEARRQVDDALDRCVPPLGTSPAIVHEGMRYTLLLPGKRLRGILVLMAAEVCRGSAVQVMPLACAVEMVHACSLILDDLPSMDNASLRRGKPVLHRIVGEDQAVLAAVALLNAAFDLIHSAPKLKDRQRRELTRRMAAAIGPGGLIGGQAVDLQSTGHRITLDELEFIHAHKTGALFTAAAELGGLGIGGRERDVECLRRFAKNLGLAFQITDDLLDYSAGPETTGKDAGLDVDKTTFVDLCGIEGARKLVDELIDASLDALKPLGRRGGRLTGFAEMVRLRDR